MKNLYILILFISVQLSAQRVAHRSYIADNGIKYKSGDRINYKGSNYKIKKIFQDTESQIFYIQLKGRDKFEIEVNKEIESCNVKPCEIDPNAKYDCEYLKNKIDENTNQRVVKLKPKALYSKGEFSDSATVYGMVQENTKILVFKIFSYNTFSFKKGDQIMLKTSDDDIIKLDNFNDVVAEHKTIKKLNTAFWIAEMKVVLTDELVDKLKDRRLVKVSYNTSKGNVDSDVRDKYSMNVARIVGCLTNKF
ncbi:hypothetical protein ABW636_02400 [Aquimarina sp. 2201CG1-2-11]|uniref:hypothetical protein n=1 Tax=Aquimarina discodermiae TaxID=3231043 RepID=UPI003462838E